MTASKLLNCTKSRVIKGAKPVLNPQPFALYGAVRNLSYTNLPDIKSHSEVDKVFTLIPV